MIHFDDICFSYEDGTRVLDHLSLHIPPCRTVALLGASGSGKTTLLHILLGLLKPQSGRVLVDGQDIVGLSERQLTPVRQKMGVVFQDGALFDSLTVGENVCFQLRESGDMDEDAMEARTLKVLKYVGLEHTIDQMPSELSGGMRRRVAVARAMAAFDPQIMLYDEPTSGLDPITADTVCDLMRKVADGKCLTSIMVTHRLRDGFKVADEMVLLKDGQIRFTGDREALLASDDPYIQQFMA